MLFAMTFSRLPEMRPPLQTVSAVRDTVDMHARRVGHDALLVECADVVEVAATYAALVARADEVRATDIVPAARTVLLDGLADVSRVAGIVEALAPARATAPVTDARHVEIPVSYDGPDLDEVARQWQVSTAEVVGVHRDTDFVVAFCGFAPGFAYCTGLPRHLSVQRRHEPRTRVPAGSVALAGEFTGVYPTSSPGGWQLIGRTRLAVWRPEENPPALLPPGTRVRFVDA